MFVGIWGFRVLRHHKAVGACIIVLLGDPHVNKITKGSVRWGAAVLRLNTGGRVKLKKYFACEERCVRCRVQGGPHGGKGRAVMRPLGCTR